MRPTSDRAREAVFDILAHGRFAEGDACRDAMVLDAFAGTGAFGLEALSRGARHATFLEKNRAAREALKANITALGETRQATIMTADAANPPRPSGAATLAFLDPPYHEDLASPALEARAETGWLAADALVIVEISSRETLDPPAGFTLLDERRYGAAKFAFFRYSPPA